MNTNRIFSTSARSIVLGLLLSAAAGCRHETEPPKITTPISETQAPLVKRPARAVDSRERELQLQIENMQEQIKVLTARTEGLAGFHSVRMGPKWDAKVEAARAGASRPDERMRYLEATKALLARKLQALRAEMKVYEDYEASDPAIPRP